MGFGARVAGMALIVGAGALAVTAIVMAPRALKAARPLVREGLKRGLGLYKQARTAMAEFAEDAEDLIAEVRSDLPSEHVSRTPREAERG